MALLGAHLHVLVIFCILTWMASTHQLIEEAADIPTTRF